MRSLDLTRLRVIILALACALVLSGCSAIKLGYSNLPNLAYWWLDGYVDFSDEQAPRARDEIARLHAWHRQHELPRILDLLARMEQLAAGEFTAPQACAFVPELQARMRAVTEQAEPGVIALASALTGRELRHMQRKFRRNNERFREEWIAIPPPQRLDKRMEQMVERMETIYGPLQQAQKAVLRQRLEQSVYDPVRTAGEWQRRQDDLLQILRRLSQRGVPDAEARALLRGWVARMEKAPDAGYRAYQEALQQEGCSTFAALHRSTTPGQREQAVRRLKAYQRDVRDLMAQP